MRITRSRVATNYWYNINKLNSTVFIYLFTYLLTYLYFNPRSPTTIQDAKRISIKIHFTGYRTALLQIYNWLMYAHIIIQKILEKTKINVILKRRCHGSIRVAEGSNDRQGIYLEGFRTVNSDG